MKYKWNSKKTLETPNPADTGRKLNVLCTFNLRPVSTGNIPMHLWKNETKKTNKNKGA